MELTLHHEFPAELAGEWNALLNESIEHVPFLRFEYLEAWWKTRGGGEWPEEASLQIVTAKDVGRLVGVAPLFYTPSWQGKRALLLIGAVEVSDYLDLIVRPENLPAFLDALLPFLADPSSGLPDWERLDLYNLLDSSPTLKAAPVSAEAAGWAFAAEQLQHSPYIPLPGDWETYLAGIDKKQRHEIRRKMRRSEESDARVEWYIVSDPAALEDEANAFMDLMAQDPDKARFLTPPMREHMRLTMRCAFAEGCLQLAFLTVNGAKAAGYFSLDYLNRIWVYNSGIDQTYREYSPGWVLLGNLLQWANENKREAFDFMRGDEDYKYRFGGIDRFVMRAMIDRR